MAVRVLEEQLVNMIAAGEVVERPASVLKELVENALDASATQVRVTLSAGGRDLVSIHDDGEGMDRADALLCLERHATSKITAAADLFRIGTLGFRGEAIPSIASVSCFTLTTRRHDADVGTRVRVEGGKLMDVAPAGAAPGTEVRVQDLFFNVPARRKFLRTAETELGHCQEALTREALIRPDVDWELVHDGRTLLRAAPTDDWRQRAADLLGPHGEALVPADISRGTLEVRGLVSPVGVHRQSPQGTSWLYVNGRFVKDALLRRAVAQAYAGIVPKDRHPVVILDVRLPPGDVDVNVHPAKTEVRFTEGYALQAAIAAGLRAALQDQGIRRPVAVEGRYRAPGEARAPEAQVSLGIAVPVAFPAVEAAPAPAREATGRWGVAPVGTAPLEASAGGVAGTPPRLGPQGPVAASVGRERSPEGDAEPGSATVGTAPLEASAGGVAGGRAPPPQESRPREAPEAPPREAAPAGAFPAARRGAEPLVPGGRFAELRVLAQHANTYILCESRGALVLVDQHAAHERVNLVRLERNPAAALGPSQQLLTPVMVELPAGRARALAARVDALAAMGLDLRPMGGHSFAVQGVPGALARADLRALVADLADEAAEEVHGMAVSGPLERVLATMACHGSVKAGQELSHHEMRALLVALDEVDFGVCAHGRPVAIRLDSAELERRFHRT